MQSLKPGPPISVYLIVINCRLHLEIICFSKLPNNITNTFKINQPAVETVVHL